MFARVMAQFDSMRDKSSGLDIDWEDVHHTLLDFCVRIFPKVVSAERCSIFIHDPEKDEVWLKAHTGAQEKEISASLTEESIVGEVIATGKPVVINDLEDVEGIHKKIDQETGFTTRDILCIPIRSLDGEKITGAVQMLNRMYGHKFSDADLRLMEEMAQFLEQSLENIYYRNVSQSVVQSATRITRAASLASLAFIVGITGAFSVWVLWVAVKSFM